MGKKTIRCPKCSHEQSDPVECAGCGLIFARYEQHQARRLEQEPGRARWFRMVWENRKYRVFRILTRAEEGAARRYGTEAEDALQKGELDRAEERATSALLLDPGEETAQRILQHVGSLRRQGFRSEGNENP